MTSASSVYSRRRTLQWFHSVSEPRVISITPMIQATPWKTGSAVSGTGAGGSP